MTYANRTETAYVYNLECLKKDIMTFFVFKSCDYVVTKSLYNKSNLKVSTGCQIFLGPVHNLEFQRTTKTFFSNFKVVIHNI